MRVLIWVFAMVALATAAQARDEPTQILLSTDKMAGKVSGTTLPDKPLSFFLLSPARADLKITVAASNDDCGFEMKRSSSRGFQSEIGRFPATRTYNAQQGETFTFSFFQTRSAFMQRKGCSFTLSVN